MSGLFSPGSQLTLQHQPGMNDIGKTWAMLRQLIAGVSLAAVAILVMLPAGPASAAIDDACLTPVSRELRLYQSLMYAGAPDMMRHGFARAHIVDRDIWVDEKTRQRISPQKLAATVSRLGRDGGLVVLDIEHLPLTGNSRGVASTLDLLSGAGTLARRSVGNAEVGFYGLLPLSEYWRPINLHPDGGGFRQWQADSRRLQPLDAALDVNLPSLYAHYEDRKGWVQQAEALVCEARRQSSKPVIAFIWPEYHSGAMPVGTYLPHDYWRLQLETMARIADGVVIWGGYDFEKPGQQQWNARAPWWQETLAFLERHRRDPTLRPVSAGR